MIACTLKVIVWNLWVIRLIAARLQNIVKISSINCELVWFIVGSPCFFCCCCCVFVAVENFKCHLNRATTCCSYTTIYQSFRLSANSIWNSFRTLWTSLHMYSPHIRSAVQRIDNHQNEKVYKCRYQVKKNNYNTNYYYYYKHK